MTKSTETALLERASLGILGSGSWGTALAIAFAASREVLLWGRDKELLRAIQRDRQNAKYLPGKHVSQVKIQEDVALLFERCRVIIVALPVKALETVLSGMSQWISDEHVLVCVSKGMDVDTFQRSSEIMDRVVPQKKGIVVLSGPSHAEEVAAHMPTSLVCTSRHQSLMGWGQRYFTTKHLRIYTNADIIGVEVAAALKNVIAVASGVVKGMGYGINTTAALISRGMVEMCRLGNYLGASERTFFGLAGLGDLIATCTSSYSRNYQVGMRLAKGQSLEAITQSMVMIAEGIRTVQAVHSYVRERPIEMPITGALYRVLFEGKKVDMEMATLMNRRPKSEF